VQAVEAMLARVDAALALEPGLAVAHVVRGLVLVAQRPIGEARAGVRAGDRSRAEQRQRPLRGAAHAAAGRAEACEKPRGPAPFQDMLELQAKLERHLRNAR